MLKKNQYPFVFETVQPINRPVVEIFSFFSKAENLQILTPNRLNFKILTPLPIEMRRGTVIDYQLQLMGIPVKWKTEITVWEPPFRFVDEQLSGPYKLWRHEHSFKEENRVTWMRDTVQYDFFGWFLRNLIHYAFVKPQIRKIFDYRCLQIEKLFNISDTKALNKNESA
jgi:ligand-binding SRPBCC domain-containing protein